MKPKYESLAELIQAYHDHKVTMPLILDNDSTSIWPEADDDHQPVFDMHPEELLEQALDLLGIPHEHV